MKTPTTQQLQAELAEARRLIDLQGENHPAALLAMVRAIYLADPGFMDRELAESGIALPTATHCTADGAPLYSASQVAQAVRRPVQEVQDTIAELAECGGLQLHAGQTFRRQ